MSKDGTTNSIGTSANAAVGATKAALPQHVPGSDSDSAQILDGDIDSRIGAQNKASDQKGVTQDSKTDVDLKSKIQAAGENGDSQNGAQNEASMGDQKGETRTDIILWGGMQDDKSANDSKTEMQSEGVTHISKAEHISCLEPQLKNDQGASANGEVCGV